MLWLPTLQCHTRAVPGCQHLRFCFSMVLDLPFFSAGVSTCVWKMEKAKQNKQKSTHKKNRAWTFRSSRNIVLLCIRYAGWVPPTRLMQPHTSTTNCFLSHGADFDLSSQSGTRRGTARLRGRSCSPAQRQAAPQRPAVRAPLRWLHREELPRPGVQSGDQEPEPRERRSWHRPGPQRRPPPGPAKPAGALRQHRRPVAAAARPSSAGAFPPRHPLFGSPPEGKGAGLPAACGEGGHGPRRPRAVGASELLQRLFPRTGGEGKLRRRSQRNWKALFSLLKLIDFFPPQVILCVYSLWRPMHQWAGGIPNDR